MRNEEVKCEHKPAQRRAEKDVCAADRPSYLHLICAQNAGALRGCFRGKFQEVEGGKYEE